MSPIPSEMFLRLLQGGVREALAWKSQRLYRCIKDMNRLSAVSLIFPNFLYVQKGGKNIKQARCVRDQKIDYDLPYRAHSFFFTIRSQYSKTCQSKENPFWLKKIFLLAP